MIRSVINYLALKYPESGFKKEPVKVEALLEVLKKEGVNIHPVSHEEMSKELPPEKIGNFRAYLCYMKNQNFVEPYLFYDNSVATNKKWFAIAHEMGHFFMHSYATNGFANRGGINGWKGRLEFEADLFANHIFLPDKIINDKYQKEIHKCITHRSAEDLNHLFEKVYQFCFDHCCDLLKVDLDSIHPRAILNLKLRANRYLAGIREKLFIYNHDMDNPCLLSLKNKEYEYETDPFEIYLNMRRN